MHSLVEYPDRAAVHLGDRRLATSYLALVVRAENPDGMFQLLRTVAVGAARAAATTIS